MNYFSVADRQENLLPHYIGIGNYRCDDTEEMIKGTQNVVSGRLDDGAFYYDTDLQTPLIDLNKKLENQIFQENMGTLYDKQLRLKELCKKISALLSRNKDSVPMNETILTAAAEFCKADLKTGCVQEFPDEMQGVMGGILFEHQNILSDKQASHHAGLAIAEHYLPKSLDSALPQTNYGLILSLADKLDSLCMMINHGIQIEGSKDPFGMRRLAISIVRLLGLDTKGKTKMNFPALSEIISCWKDVSASSGREIKDKFDTNLKKFMFERIKAFLRDNTESDDSFKIHIQVIEALEKQFFERPLVQAKEFAIEINNRLNQTGENSLKSALIPYHRAKNLTQDIMITEIDESKFTTPFEKNLYQALISTEKEIQHALEQDDFTSYLNSLQKLTKPLADLFDNVMINDPDEKLKHNRLSMLCKICGLYEEVANFGAIQVQ